MCMQCVPFIARVLMCAQIPFLPLSTSLSLALSRSANLLNNRVIPSKVLRSTSLVAAGRRRALLRHRKPQSSHYICKILPKRLVVCRHCLMHADKRELGRRRNTSPRPLSGPHPTRCRCQRLGKNARHAPGPLLHRHYRMQSACDSTPRTRACDPPTNSTPLQDAAAMLSAAARATLWADCGPLR